MAESPKVESVQQVIEGLAKEYERSKAFVEALRASLGRSDRHKESPGQASAGFTADSDPVTGDPDAASASADELPEQPVPHARKGIMARIAEKFKGKSSPASASEERPYRHLHPPADGPQPLHLAHQHHQRRASLCEPSTRLAAPSRSSLEIKTGKLCFDDKAAHLPPAQLRPDSLPSFSHLPATANRVRLAALSPPSLNTLEIPTEQSSPSHPFSRQSNPASASAFCALSTGGSATLVDQPSSSLDPFSRLSQNDCHTSALSPQGPSSYSRLVSRIPSYSLGRPTTAPPLSSVDLSAAFSYPTSAACSPTAASSPGAHGATCCCLPQDAHAQQPPSSPYSTGPAPPVASMEHLRTTQQQHPQQQPQPGRSVGFRRPASRAACASVGCGPCQDAVAAADPRPGHTPPGAARRHAPLSSCSTHMAMSLQLHGNAPQQQLLVDAGVSTGARFEGLLTSEQGCVSLATGSTSPAAARRQQLHMPGALLASDTPSAPLVQHLHVHASPACSTTHNFPLSTLGSGAWSPSRRTVSSPFTSTHTPEQHPVPLPPQQQERIWKMVQAACAPAPPAPAHDVLQGAWTAQSIPAAKSEHHEGTEGPLPSRPAARWAADVAPAAVYGRR